MTALVLIAAVSAAIMIFLTRAGGGKMRCCKGCHGCGKCFGKGNK